MNKDERLEQLETKIRTANRRIFDAKAEIVKCQREIKRINKEGTKQ